VFDIAGTDDLCVGPERRRDDMTVVPIGQGEVADADVVGLGWLDHGIREGAGQSTDQGGGGLLGETRDVGDEVFGDLIEDGLAPTSCKIGAPGRPASCVP
jgi:hypothetical protein